MASYRIVPWPFEPLIGPDPFDPAAPPVDPLPSADPRPLTAAAAWPLPAASLGRSRAASSSRRLSAALRAEAARAWEKPIDS